MAERQETRQEQETRWNTQRTARKEEQAGYRARRKKNKRLWLTVAVIVPIAVIAAVVLL
jgi:type IV secretory pathway component VirB8